jgi:hypothetical protein
MLPVESVSNSLISMSTILGVAFILATERHLLNSSNGTYPYLSLSVAYSSALRTLKSFSGNFQAK